MKFNQSTLPPSFKTSQSVVYSKSEFKDSKKRCKRQIKQAIKHEEKSVEIDVGNCFKSAVRVRDHMTLNYIPPEIIDDVYNSLKDHFWNKKRTIISFRVGKGSVVDVMRPIDILKKVKERLTQDKIDEIFEIMLDESKKTRIVMIETQLYMTKFALAYLRRKLSIEDIKIRSINGQLYLLNNNLDFSCHQRRLEAWEIESDNREHKMR